MQLIKPFGDHADDGIVQLSFTLPMPNSPAGKNAARAVAGQMGLKNIDIVHAMALNTSCSYYVVYGSVDYGADPLEAAKGETDYAILSKEDVERAVAGWGRPLTVIGASTGTDTHSVGIDAILNHKGYNGHAGLEAYRGFRVANLGSQVPNEKLIAEALRIEADAILVSQTVTQQDLHVANLTELVDLLEAEGLRERFVLICGGPRISAALSKELGYDAGFSKGTFAEHVASFLVSHLQAQKALQQEASHAA